MKDYKILSKKEEEFYDLVGEEILKKEKNLAVSSPYQFLAGSAIAFDYLMSCIGSIKTKRILDYGCGSGWLAVYFAKLGAEVEGFDISENLLRVAQKRAVFNEVQDKVNFRKLAAENLLYPNNYFDLVIGIGILHHLDLEMVGPELKRVLRNGGKALFLEPFGESKFLNFLRNYLLRVHCGHWKNKLNEHPLTYSNIKALGRHFSYFNYKEYQFVSMISRLISDKFSEVFKLNNFDEFLLNRFPSLKKYCRLIVINLIK